jgi:carbon-monoxide dehydrogenase catalytic subunit
MLHPLSSPRRRRSTAILERARFHHDPDHPDHTHLPGEEDAFHPMPTLTGLGAYRKTFPKKADVVAKTPDPAVRQMLTHMAEQGCETCFDRFDAQTPQCGFGLAGTCCRICNMGPCKVTAKSPRGVCGADADVIVARNLLRWVASGVASHGARGREVMLALKWASEGKLDLPILGHEKVLKVAQALKLDAAGKDVKQLAGEIADALLADLSRTIPEGHRTLHALAPAERIETWRKLGILPVGAYHEVFEALHRTGTGTDGDWENLMLQMLRCGLAFAWTSVVGSAIAMDCLYGLPKRSRIETNLGVLEDGYVSLALHGHSPVMVGSIVEASRRAEFVGQAEAAGAKGIRLYGICCSGLSALYRMGGVHPLTNAMGAELALGTGALDLWVADVQDVYPSIMDVAKCFGTEVVTTSDSGRLPGATHIAFDHEHSNLSEVRQLGERIVGTAIRRHGQRAGRPRFVPDTKIEAEVGFSIENVIAHFGSAAAIAEHVKAGRIRGIVNLVGCSNPKVLYERAVLDVAEALIAQDVLLLTNGCASFPLMKLGLCRAEALQQSGPGLRTVLGGFKEPLPPVWHMGECLDNARASGLFRTLADALGQPMRALPFAFSSPEWSNEKGVGAALSFRLLGLNSYHCVAAPVFGSENVQRYLARDTHAILGSVMIVDPDPAVLAARIIHDLKVRRRRLGWAE